MVGRDERPPTLVLVEEVGSGDWGIAGTGYGTSDVKALAAAGRKG